MKRISLMLKALASGGYGSEGIPEQVEDGVNGRLVPQGDAVAMAEMVIKLLTDDALRMRLDSNAVEDAQRRFDLNRQVDDYISWYREILENWQRKKKPQ